MDCQTFWLYYMDKPVAAVRLHKEATDEDVRQKAADQQRLFCFCDREQGELPTDRLRKILVSEVRVYE